MVLHIDCYGRVECVYSEAIDLAALGPLSIRRASQVEPDGHGQWWADLVRSGGPMLGPFPLRSEALQSEQVWLAQHFLGRTEPSDAL